MDDKQIEKPANLAVALWGVLGVLAILGQAIWRLGGLAMEPIVEGSLSGTGWALYGLSIAFNAYAEGYKAFQLQFSPRVVARAFHLARNPRPLHVALAPFYCMALFHATRKRLIVSWTVLLGVVTIVLAVRQLPQPWRGIVDAGVVVGLGWGCLAIAWFFARAARGQALPVPPDVPA